jgi:hypothetical protein
MESFEVVSASGNHWKFENNGKMIIARVNAGEYVTSLFHDRAQVRAFCDKLMLLAEGFEDE